MSACERISQPTFRENRCRSSKTKCPLRINKDYFPFPRHLTKQRKYGFHFSCCCSKKAKSLGPVGSSDDDDAVAMFTDQVEKKLENVPFARDLRPSIDSKENAPPRNMPGATSSSSFQESEFVLILVACCIGVSTGVGVVVFNDAVAGIRHFIWGDVTVLDGRQVLERIPWDALYPRLLLPPVLASFIVGCISALTKPEDESRHFRTPLEKLGRLGSSIVGLGSGVSLGPEGPSVEIGVDISQVFAGKFGNGKKNIKSLLAAGSGAGVAAGFNAPISGVFFAVESVLQREPYVPNRSGSSQERESSGISIAMILLASVLAAVVSQAGLGSSPAFLVPDYSLESLYELPLYIVFGGVCGVVSSLFLYNLELAAHFFSMLDPGSPAESLLQGSDEKSDFLMRKIVCTIGFPVIGGLITGCFALQYPEILYEGFDNVNAVLNAPHGDYTVQILVQIVLLKIVATSICRGSGLKGGIYAPSIFLGAALGSAFGLSCQNLADIMGMAVSPPQAFALVGVGAMLASACDVPLTSILLLFELTRDYLIILPTLAAVGISYWVSSNFLIWKQEHNVSPPERTISNISQTADTWESQEEPGKNSSQYMIISKGIDLTVNQICALLQESGEQSTAVIMDTNNKEVAKVVLSNEKKPRKLR